MVPKDNEKRRQTLLQLLYMLSHACISTIFARFLLVGFAVSLVTSVATSFLAGSWPIKRTFCAQPAYSPNLATNASATTMLSFGVRLLPASSGNIYCVATCKLHMVRVWRLKQNMLSDHIEHIQRIFLDTASLRFKCIFWYHTSCCHFWTERPFCITFSGDWLLHPFQRMKILFPDNITIWYWYIHQPMKFKHD